MGKPVIIIVKSRTGCISGSCYRRTACATAHNFCFQMEIVHYFPPFCAAAQFLFLFLKKKIGAVNAAPISAIKLPVADFRRQLAQGRVQFCTPADKRISGCTCGNCVDNDSNLKKCGIVHKAPKEPQSLAERTTPKGIPPPILWVVSKCALRDGSKATKAYAFNRSYVFNRLFSSIFTSSSSMV